MKTGEWKQELDVDVREMIVCRFEINSGSECENIVILVYFLYIK